MAGREAEHPASATLRSGEEEILPAELGRRCIAKQGREVVVKNEDVFVFRIPLTPGACVPRA
jgi:hypothetical protein